jgi:hypothetical protein
VQPQLSSAANPSLIRWRPVLGAALATSLLAAGFVGALGITARQGADALKIELPSHENATVERTQPAEGTADSGTRPEQRSEGESTPSTIGSAPIELEASAGRDLANPAADVLSSRPTCESYGTAIQFLSRPADAARQARQEGKLLFLLHVSGNFEDAKFT